MKRAAHMVLGVTAIMSLGIVSGIAALTLLAGYIVY